MAARETIIRTTRTTSQPAATMATRCPRCGGALLPVEDNDQGCVACGWRCNMTETEMERRSDRLNEDLHLELEPIDVAAWPARTTRAMQYDEIIRLVIYYDERGQGLRFRITDANRTQIMPGALKPALERAGLVGKTISVRDVHGYRYLRISDAQPGKARKPKATPKATPAGPSS